MAEAAAPLDVLVESPAIAGSRAAQIALLSSLRVAVDGRNLRLWVVADEWCNTLDDTRAFADARAGHAMQVKMPDLGGIEASVEAVLHCRHVGMGVYLGGSANETEVSARVSAHVALATAPNFVLAKPGLGGDEGLMILGNEMARTLALMATRRHCQVV
jgi:methylaspartate ammonia-lyase